MRVRVCVGGEAYFNPPVTPPLPYTISQLISAVNRIKTTLHWTLSPAMLCTLFVLRLGIGLTNDHNLYTTLGPTVYTFLCSHCVFTIYFVSQQCPQSV